MLSVLLGHVPNTCSPNAFHGIWDSSRHEGPQTDLGPLVKQMTLEFDLYKICKMSCPGFETQVLCEKWRPTCYKTTRLLPLEAKMASTRRCPQRARRFQNNLTISNNLVRLSKLSNRTVCFRILHAARKLQTHRGTCHLKSGTRMVHSKIFHGEVVRSYSCANATPQFHSSTVLASQPSGETSHAVWPCGKSCSIHIFRCATCWKMRKPFGALRKNYKAKPSKLKSGKFLWNLFGTLKYGGL